MTNFWCRKNYFSEKMYSDNELNEKTAKKPGFFYNF